MPLITNYADCIGVSYAPLEDVDRSDYRFTVPVWLVNGRMTEATVCARRVKGGFKVTQLLLPKELSREDVQDLGDFDWHVFPKARRGTRIPPLMHVWEETALDEIVVACVPVIDKERWVAFNVQEKMPYVFRELCPWPNFRLAAQFGKAFSRLQGKALGIAFYPLQEYLGKQVAQGTDIQNPGIAYSRFLRDLRTFLLAAQERSIPVVLKLGSVDRALEAMEKRGLDWGKTQSWEAVEDVFPDMPEVLVEEKWASDIRGRAADLKANVGFMGHMGAAGFIDCVIAEFFDLEAVLAGRLVCWLNPLAPPEETLEKAQKILADRVTKLTQNVTVSDKVQPFPEDQFAARSLCF